MKKALLFAMAAMIGVSTSNCINGNIVYAAKQVANRDVEDHNSFINTNGNYEKSKAEFAYEMSQITANLLSAPVTDMVSFKTDFAYATAQATTKVMSMVPVDQRNELAYRLAQLTARVVSDQEVDVQKAKADFTYEIAQITTKMISYANTSYSTSYASSPKVAVRTDKETKVLLRNNADVEQHVIPKTNGNANGKLAVNKGNIDMKTYNTLVDELMHTDEQKNELNKVNFNGEVRYHYAFNHGSSIWDKDASGFRTYLGFDTVINEDWRAAAMFEGNKNILNYKDDFKLTRFYATGKTGITNITAGAFGYLMAEGNIYDSSYTGLKFDFGKQLKYSMSLGKTDSTKTTYTAIVHYDDYDYNLEAGVYYNRMDDDGQTKRTIWTLAGNYNFSNFGVGAMYLGSNQKDSNGAGRGYVFTLSYGDLKTYRNNTYNIVAKYYNQPLGTYISHGMNGLGNTMQGFKGYSFGLHYTFAKNMVAGIEYYGLTDKVTGEKSKTLWNEINYYF